MPFTKITSQVIACQPESIINSKIAIPRVGDMFAINSNSEYWTIGNSSDDKANVISTDCSTREVSLDSLSSILPVAVINNNVLITGGNGTEDSPYTIE